MMTNLLPYNGVVFYFGKTVLEEEATGFYNRLLQTIAWKNEEAVIYGKHITTKRKVAWYGDQPFAYTYSGITKQALLWTPELTDIKRRAEKQTGETFNSCLLNLYHTGEEGMGWHSDNEPSIVAESAIASVSLGAERLFSFRHKQTKETVSLLLENGSLLLMKEATQKYWQHSLPKTKKIKEARINLTFRRMKENTVV